jgi:UDP-N-acetylmuramyl pentapeptide phosphotransferase/UDP-N-acetylglucosamine-1-phosphate transferase
MSLKKIALLSMSVVFLFSTTSCIVHVRPEGRKHKSWYKNKNNPHHPRTTNPGRVKPEEHPKGHHKGKSKGKR